MEMWNAMQKMVYRTLSSVLGAALLFVASAPGVANAQAQAAPASPATDTDYRLGIADKVRVTVFNEPTLSTEYVINADGNLSFPLIGNVPAAGKTSTELQDELTRRLANGYLLNPSVAVQTLSNRPFYILGEVSRPGEYAYSSGLTAMKAVAMAQGFTYRANKKTIYLRRAGDTNETKVSASDDPPIQPGDTIRIAERYF